MSDKQDADNVNLDSPLTSPATQTSDTATTTTATAAADGDENDPEPSPLAEPCANDYVSLASLATMSVPPPSTPPSQIKHSLSQVLPLYYYYYYYYFFYLCVYLRNANVKNAYDE